MVLYYIYNYSCIPGLKCRQLYHPIARPGLEVGIALGLLGTSSRQLHDQY